MSENLKEQPVMSVVVPVFNTGQYLKQCLDSLVVQTLEGIEIICVDNGSTDESPAILRDYETRYHNVVMLIHSKGRQGDARNAGMAVATGEYIGFVDSDDFCDPDMFLRLYSRAKEATADIAICNIRCFRDDTEDCSVIIEPENLSENDGFSVSERPVLFRNMTICNKLFRRSFVLKHALKFPEDLWHEDQLFVSKALFVAERIVTVPECLYHYRKGRQGSVGAHEGLRNLDIFVVMGLMFDFVESTLDAEEERLAQEVRILRYLYLYPSCGRKVRRTYYVRMRAEFRELEISSEFRLLKRSEVREFRAILGALGYFGYSAFLAARMIYGVMRRNLQNG